jgi:hypothetical protein
MSGYGNANTWSTGPTNPPSWAPKQPTQQQLDIIYRYPAGPGRDSMAKVMGITNYNRYGGYNKTRKRKSIRRRKSRRMKSRRRK